MAFNMDALINKVGLEIAEKEDKNNIEKALSILSNDGVYAYYIFCKSKDLDKNLISTLEIVFQRIGKGKYWEGGELMVERLSEDLPQLFLVKEIIEKVLIYARYYSRMEKAKEKREKE